MSEVSTQFLSVDCFLDNRMVSSDVGDRIIFKKAMILACFPVAVTLTSIITWKGIFVVNAWRNKEKNIAILPRDHASAVE